VQIFAVAGDGHMMLLTATSAQPSFTSVAIAAGGTTVFRAIDTGLQSFQLGNSSLGPPHLINGTISAAGVGLDVFGGIGVRAHPTGIDIFDVSDPAHMRLLGSPGGVPSLTGVDVKIFGNGTRAIRAESNGIEIYDLSQPAARAPIDENNTAGTPSSYCLAGICFSGVAIAVDAAGTLAVRVTPAGIELYDLTAAGLPRLDNCSPSNSNCSARASTTGVGVTISGNTVFRALDSGVEAFSAANPRSPVLLSVIPATPAFAGVGLTSR
jgi:hypothetical protein